MDASPSNSLRATVSDEAVALGLFIRFRGWYTDGNVSITSFLLKATAEVIVPSVDSAGAAFAFHIIVAVFGFNFVTADVAANSILDNHELFSLKSSLMRDAPYITPSRKAFSS